MKGLGLNKGLGIAFCGVFLGMFENDFGPWSFHMR